MKPPAAEKPADRLEEQLAAGLARLEEQLAAGLARLAADRIDENRLAIEVAQRRLNALQQNQ
jgi:hypothetical protein